MAGNGVTLEEIVDLAVSRAMSRGVAEISDRIEAMRLALPPQLGTVKQAAGALGVCTRTVWRLIGEGRVHASKIGTKTVVDLARLNEVPKPIAANPKRKVRS